MALNSYFKRSLRLLRDPQKIKKKIDLWKISQLPRYQIFQSEILGKPIKIIDSASFTFMYDEIFNSEIYKFTCDHDRPLIIDCGANIGLSIIYFKQLFPKAKILAFEPDRKAIASLRFNIESFGFSDVQVLERAVWNEETTLEFLAEGADGGRIVAIENQNFSKHIVETVRLRDYLQEQVDFLKIDIEGAETEVILDCRDLLKNIRNLFIEYHSFVERPQTLHVITSVLAEAGFRIHIHPPVISPHPFVSRNVHMGMDMQLNIFAFRDSHEMS
jgi:FkbM family methyltransferase